MRRLSTRGLVFATRVLGQTAFCASTASESAHPSPPALKVSKEDVTSLTKLLYHEHYRPAQALDGEPVDRDGWFSARSELRWIVEWARANSTDQASFDRLMKHAVLDRVDLHKPLSLVLGTQPFLGLEIICQKDILIPRPETEQWTEWVLSRLWKKRIPVHEPGKPAPNEPELDIEKPDKSTFVIKPTGKVAPSVDEQQQEEETLKEDRKVLDMCCGTGCVGVALAAKSSRLSVVSADINPAAVALALRNAKEARVPSHRYAAVRSDMFKDLAKAHLGTFDCICINPPYILPSQYDQLPRHIVDWESKTALVGDDRHAISAMSYYEEICAEGWKWLKAEAAGDHPQLVMEVGLQADHVADLFDNNKQHWKNIVVHTDAFDQPRWICVDRAE